MRVLFVGDLVGKSGRAAACARIPALRQNLDADIVIVNGENVAGGIGITAEIADDLLDAEVDAITLGNHAWAKREALGLVDQEPRVLRPANYVPGTPGRGLGIYETRRGPVAVVCLLGRVFMDPVDDPFRAADAAIAEARRVTPHVVVDMHAEATSEKQAMGWYLDGRATAVLGTHTHVQTADERILPRGTAFITDVGMTGPTNSVIGMSVETALPRFTTSAPTRFEVASGVATLCAVLVEADDTTGLARSITRLQISPDAA